MHDEQMVNGLRKIAWPSVACFWFEMAAYIYSYKYIQYIYTYIYKYPAVSIIYILWRACNLTAFTHSLTGPVGQPFASHHEGPGFNPRGGCLCETGILLLVLSRYIGDPGVIPDHCGLV
jgi:hypothetical protein